MIKIFTPLFLLFCSFGIQNSYAQNTLTTALKEQGFENIRLLETEDACTISIENKSYRSDVLGITLAMNTISDQIEDNKQINLLLLDNGLPVLVFRVQVQAWKEFKKEGISPDDFSGHFEVSRDVRSEWERIKSISPENRVIRQADLIFYPNMAFRNTRRDKIYETRFEIAPALEHSLWKGNKITGQVIFPIHNELGYEGDFIRPGFVTLTQNINLPKRWFAQLSSGNFSNNRYGFSGSLNHSFKNENWLLELNAGLTGASHFYDYTWTHTALEAFTASAFLSWMCPQFNLQFKGGVAQYIYKDKGLYGSLTRYFGETMVEFYAMLGEDDFNGGFRVSIPLPGKKRIRKGKIIKITIPESYCLSYNAGTELYYGQMFSSNRVNNKRRMRKFPVVLKNQIVHF